MTNKDIMEHIGVASFLASRFYVCNLHVHSPASYDYGKSSDLIGSTNIILDNERELSHQEWITEVEKNGIDIIAITDHNICSWSCKASTCHTKSLVVLPGCEISVKQTTSLTDQVVHLLAIFDHEIESSCINQIFSWSKCKSTEDNRSKDYVLNADLSQVVSNIKQLGGICIAAHVGSDKGLRTANEMLSFELIALKHELDELDKITNRNSIQNERKKIEDTVKLTKYDLQNSYLKFLIDSGINAVQISKPEDEEHYRLIHTIQVGGNIPIACILATDSHRLCDIFLPKYVTYIKMATPSVRGLTKAFNDPATRIRFNTTLPKIPYPRIRGLVMSGKESFFTRQQKLDQVPIGFADNLTCIIGGRGSGKSCIIEGLRFILGHNNTKHSKENYKKYINHLFSNTTLSLVYDYQEEETLIVKRAFDISGKSIVEEPNGNQRHISPENSSELRIDIYGQSELEEVALDKTTQRRLIDALVVDSEQLSSEINNINHKLSTNSNLCIQKAKEIQQLNNQLQELKDVKQNLDFFKDPKLQPLIEQNNFAREIDAFRLNVDGSTKETFSAFEKFHKDLLEKNQKCSELIKCESICKDSTFFINVKTSLIELSKNLTALLECIVAVLNKSDDIDHSLVNLSEKVQQSKDTIVKEMKTIVSNEDGNKLSEIIEKRQQLEKKYTELHPYEVKREQLHTDLLKLLREERIAILSEREEKTKVLFDKRNKAIQNILRELDSLPGRKLQISISLIYQSDKSLFRKCLGDSGDPGFLKGNELPNHKFEGKWAKHFSEQFSSSSFADLILNREKDKLLNIKKDDGTPLLTDDHVIKLLTARAPFSETDPYNIDTDKLQNLLNLVDGGFAEDLPEIKLDDRLIEDLSPGQRCSALLPIILLSGNWPLIIDQPEDNLDNMHVFECLVEILRVLKHRRQIICATHNANIVVSGDAEQVIVCNGEDKDSGQILRQASIDDEDIIISSEEKTIGIVTYVKDIMEGGEQAFRIRARKYGLE